MKIGALTREVERMRGRQEPQVTMLAFVDLEERVPADHPLRTIKVLADEALARLSPEFDRMYADVGRPSIPPETMGDMRFCGVPSVAFKTLEMHIPPWY